MRWEEDAALKSPARNLTLAIVILAFYGCTALGKVAASDSPAPGAASPARPVTEKLKKRLDFVLDHRVKQADVPRSLGSFSIEEYDIQDPETFWGHRALGGGNNSFSEYYLTYRKTYVILLMKDVGEVNHTCVDARLFPRTSAEYELSTGRVRVDEQPIDEDVIVLVNRKWPGSYSTDVRAAFKANLETGKIEDVKYSSIKIYREE
jgi:hypothetical protein